MNQTRPRGRDYDPWAHAEQLGLEVVTRPLRTTHGLWVPESRTIVIHSRLRTAAQRNVLAHEIGHADLGHVDDRPKHERQADVYAAQNLICPDELADVYKWAPDEARLIAELGVTTRLFRAYLLHRVA